MNKLGIIVGANLLILVLYSALFSDDILPLSGCMVLHVVVILIFGVENLSANHKEAAQAYLLSAGIVLLVGLSVCFGGR